MQLLAIILYSAVGEQRVIEFKPGALNVVTGVSATGKSALLDIVDFCLGRSTLTMAVGPISDRVSWYAVIVQLPNGQAFVARPAARQGAASTQLAMLELGTDLAPIAFERLAANADIGTVRDQLGRRIGIEENEHEAPAGSLRNSLEANLGHAMFLCLQGQGEIANRSFLFHRQGEAGIADAIKDTLPYFLGAVPRDQGTLRQRLADARRELRRAEADLQRARLVNENVEVQTRGLVTEAIALGLLPNDIAGGRFELREALQRVTVIETAQPVGDDILVVRRSELESRRSDLRARLRAIGEEISLLESLRTDGNEYGAAVSQQISRLKSIDLLGTDGSADENCPICGSHLDEVDPTVDELRRHADLLQSQLQSMDVALPARRAATARLQGEADTLRQELLGVDAAVNGLDADRQAAGATRRLNDQQVFFRGRVQQYLSTTRGTEGAALQELEQRVAVRGLAVGDIEGRLDPDEEREQIASRLAVVGTDMTRWAVTLELEHQTSVRLDLRRLTIVTDTPTGPAPLFRIGSAENWVGYHLISHLALHRYFVNELRPVPHFLMLDQLTQAYYPSDVERATGVPIADDDRRAVQRLYELMRDVAEGLSPSMQIIACDHANLPEQWFQEAVIANWRDGEKLVPQSWLDD
jgi:phage shock protein A